SVEVLKLSEPRSSITPPKRSAKDCGFSRSPHLGDYGSRRWPVAEKELRQDACAGRHDPLSPGMILNREIERIFQRTPILAEIARSRWQVTPLGGVTNQSYRLRAEGRDLVLRWPGPAASRYVDRRAELYNI